MRRLNKDVTLNLVESR